MHTLLTVIQWIYYLDVQSDYLCSLGVLIINFWIIQKMSSIRLKLLFVLLITLQFYKITNGIDSGHFKKIIRLHFGLNMNIKYSEIFNYLIYDLLQFVKYHEKHYILIINAFLIWSTKLLFSIFILKHLYNSSRTHL